MPRKECLEHPGCIWSCPCDCLNCINFETVLLRQSSPEVTYPSAVTYSSAVAYSPAVASSSRDVSSRDFWPSSSCESQSFSQPFYDALLPPPGSEAQLQEKETHDQTPESQMASPLPQAHDAKKLGG